MKITYSVDEQEDTRAVVTITPDAPINGFAGATLSIKKNAEDGEHWIEDRVRWKVDSELGLTAKEVTIVKA